MDKDPERISIDIATQLIDSLYAFLRDSKRGIYLNRVINPIIAGLIYLHDDIINSTEDTEIFEEKPLAPSLAFSLGRGIKKLVHELYTNNPLATVKKPSSLLGFFKEWGFTPLEKLEHFIIIAEEDEANLNQLKKSLTALKLKPVYLESPENLSSSKRSMEKWSRSIQLRTECFPYIKQCDNEIYKSLVKAIDESLLNPKCIDRECDLIYLLNQVKQSLFDSYAERAIPASHSLPDARCFAFGFSWRLFMPHPILALLTYFCMKTTKFSVSYMKESIKEIKRREVVCHEDIVILNLIVKHLYKLECFPTLLAEEENSLNLNEEDISIKNVYNYYLKNFPEKMPISVSEQIKTP